MRNGSEREMNLGSCPDGQHLTDSRQCGFAGCVDLGPWAKAHGYKYRFEESYKAENNMHIRGDGRWFIEVLCRNGLIYPCGGSALLAYANRGVKRHIAALEGVGHHQKSDGDSEVFKFPFERLDEVAAILRPRKRRMVTPTPRQLEVLREGRKRLDKTGLSQVLTNAVT